MSGQRIFPYRPVTTAWDIHDDTVEALSHGSKRQFGRVVVRDKQPTPVVVPGKVAILFVTHHPQCSAVLVARRLTPGARVADGV